MARPGRCCPPVLARQIADAIAAGVACHCGHGHTPPSRGPKPAREEADTDAPIRRLIADAAYKRGAEVTAIARVTGMTTAQIRGVLRSADAGAWT
jgi:hypothetical protein